MSQAADNSTVEQIRKRVRENFPELSLIKSEELRDQVVEAWAIGLAETEYRGVDEIPGCGLPGDPMIKRGADQSHHLRSTATVAIGIMEGMEKVFGPLGIDHDVVIAGALVHDVGKSFEFSPKNRSRWEKDKGRYGCPSIRHPIYGAHLALKVGLPEEIVHIVAVHSRDREGACVTPSLEALIVQYADIIVWKVGEGCGLIEGDETYPYLRVEGKLN
jgi:putative nucleotidyltransferase with HDIG domain